MFQNASAPVMFRIIPVTFPAGTLAAPSSMPGPWSFVRLTLVPMLEETLKTNLGLKLPSSELEEVELEEVEVSVEFAAEVLVAVAVVDSVRFEEYFSVMLVTLMSRYLRVALWAGASVR